MSSRGYSLERRSKNTWRVTVGAGLQADDTYGRHREPIHAKSKAEAHRQAEKIRDRVRAGINLEEANSTLQEYLEKHFKNMEGDIGDKTLYTYRRLADLYIYPYLGTTKLNQITCQSLDAFYRKLSTKGSVKTGKALSPRTINHVHIVLNKALGRAVAHGVLVANPATHTTRPSIRPSNRTALDHKELRKLSKVIESLEDRPIAAALAIGLETGMRRGEIVSLAWKDIDYEGASGAGTIRVPGTKTGKSHRTITMTGSLKELLQEYELWQEAKLKKHNVKKNKETPVITSPVCKKMCPDALTTKTGKLFREHEFPDGFSFHGLRHTHASYALAGGIPIQALSARLGHSNITQTVDTYGHLVEGIDEAVTKSFEDTLSKVLNGD